MAIDTGSRNKNQVDDDTQLIGANEEDRVTTTRDKSAADFILINSAFKSDWLTCLTYFVPSTWSTTMSQNLLLLLPEVSY